MNIPTKELNMDFKISVYGMGTWQMGGKTEHDKNNNDNADIEALKTAIDLGITHIDTAESYAEGYSEIIVSKAIQNYDRSKLFIASKASIDHLGYDDLIKAATNSIQRLNTNYLDLYYCHRFNLNIPLKETMGAMDTLVDNGLIKYIGVSNFNVNEIEEAQSYAKHKIVANQLHLNLKYREAEYRGLLDYCQKNDVMLVAWRPLQKGILLEDENTLMQNLVQKYSKTPAQIAINWLISQDNIVTLSKTTNIKHLKENLGAIGWTMEADDVDKLRNEFPNQQLVSDTVPLDK